MLRCTLFQAIQKHHLKGLETQPWQETIVLAKQVHINEVGKKITRRIFNQT